MKSGEGIASFVTRIWLEQNRNGGSAWRGHVQHVQSGNERHFRTLMELCDFMERRADATCEGLWDDSRIRPGCRNSVEGD